MCLILLKLSNRFNTDLIVFQRPRQHGGLCPPEGASSTILKFMALSLSHGSNRSGPCNYLPMTVAPLSIFDKIQGCSKHVSYKGIVTSKQCARYKGH